MKNRLHFKKSGTYRSGALVACTMTLLLTATACSIKNVVPSYRGEPSIPTIAPTPSAIIQETIKPSDIGIDFEAYETILNAKDYAALSRFFPVLSEGTPFDVGYAPSAGESWSAESTTLDRFRKETESMAMYDEPPKVSSFSLCDMDQDGEDELILEFNNSAKTFLILHQSGDKIQGVVKYTRGFQMVQTNGLYKGTSGAATNEYQRMTFENGGVQIKVLAREDSVSGEEKFWIGEEEVTPADYNKWVGDNTPGEVNWYS